ncbi:MAG: PilZ domain-containing protein [Porticoccaceae bacterium]
MSDIPAPAAAGLSYTDNMSIAWKVVDFTPGDSHLALVNESNEAFLKAVSAISEFSRETSDTAGGLSHELNRLDLKLNLLLDLVGQLIYKQLEIPSTSLVTVTSSEVIWSADRLPTSVDTLFVQLYIQRGTPKPLSFYGRVVAVVDGKARVQLIGLSESVQQWLDKLIFRHHRREVAFRKGYKTDGDATS